MITMADGEIESIDVPALFINGPASIITPIPHQTNLLGLVGQVVH
jgi:hypothetical protein